MDNSVTVVVVDKTERFRTSGLVSSVNLGSKMGSYTREKISKFRDKYSKYLGKMNVAIREVGSKIEDAYLDFDIAVNDAIDGFTDRIFERFENVGENTDGQHEEVVDEPKISSIDKLQPMISDEELRRLGIDLDSEDSITELKEFRKELLMANFQIAEDENKDTVRRGSRG